MTPVDTTGHGQQRHAERKETMTQVAEQTGLSLTADRLELADCLAAVALATKGRTTMPILKCVLIAVVGSDVVMEATDLAVRVRRVAKKVQVHSRDAAVCVSCEELLTAVRLADGDVVELSMQGDHLILKGESTRRKMLTMKAGDFPAALADDKEVARFVVPLAKLRTAFGFVQHAGHTAGGWAREGVLIEREGDGLCLAACAGTRIARADVEGTATGNEKDVVIPTDAMATMLRAMPDDDVDAAVVATHTAVRIEVPDAVACSQRFEAGFPPWRQAMGRTFTGSTTLDRKSFAAAVACASAAATELEKGVAVDLGDGGITLTCRSPERGEAEAKYPCKVDGDAVTVGIDYRFILDCLGGMGGDAVTFEWSAFNCPIRLKCGDMVEVISPMDLTNNKQK
jgi:DNA polymerase-3 subunit beta